MSEPGDLQSHRCLAFVPRPELKVWHLQDGERRQRVDPPLAFLSNNIAMIKSLTVRGSGVTLIPVSSCKKEIEDGSLAVVLPDWSMGATPIHLVYQKQPYKSPKTQAFVSFVETRVRHQFS